MIHHKDFGTTHAGMQLRLRTMIANKIICWGGNKKLKIYGTLHCTSGKKMKMANRVFFTTEQEAREAGYRPCGHCLPEKYRQWKFNMKQ